MRDNSGRAVGIRCRKWGCEWASTIVQYGGGGRVLTTKSE
jgi:hypothetical protein